MLVLSRREGEEVIIAGQITILVVSSSHGRVKLGISAPKEVAVHRAEIAARVLAETPRLAVEGVKR